VAGGSGHTHGPFSSASASPVVIVVAGVGVGLSSGDPEGSPWASLFPYPRLLPRCLRHGSLRPCPHQSLLPPPHALGHECPRAVSHVGCRHLCPHHRRFLRLRLVGCVRVRLRFGCAVDCLGCGIGRSGSTYRGVGGRAGPHGGLATGAPPSPFRSSFVSHAPS